MKNIVLFAATLLFAANAFGQAIVSSRCVEANDSLDEAGALNRTAWALKCYPHLKFFTDGGKILLKNAQTGAVTTGYPIFGQVTSPDSPAVPVVAPADPNAPCWDTTVYVQIGFCQAGCFTPEQEIFFTNPLRYEAIESATRAGATDILSVSGINGSGFLEFRDAKLFGYTVDPVEKAQQILVIKTQTGNLKVTPNHPLVDGRGYMVAANTLKVGDSLKTMYNTDSQIISIETVDYFGKVYNVDMGSTNMFENIIVANDFLSGTVYFQNDGLVNLNRLVLRSLVPEEFLN